MRAHCSLCVGGNWDYGIGGKEFSEDAYFWNQLGPERMEWLNTLPRESEITLSGIRFRLFHGRPVTPLLRCQDDSALLEEAFHTPEGGTFGGVIFADSHRPFVRTLNAGYIMNTGSIGNSLGVVRAHALVLEGERDSTVPGTLRTTVLSVPPDRICRTATRI